MATKVPDIEKLGATNYATWSQDMLAWLGTQQLKRLVLGKQKAPSPADPNNITDAEQAAIEAWEDKCEKAAGWIITLIKPDQRVHIKDMEDDPVKMWTRLESVHVVKQAGARFNSYDNFFSIRKKEDESFINFGEGGHRHRHKHRLGKNLFIQWNDALYIQNTNKDTYIYHNKTMS